MNSTNQPLQALEASIQLARQNFEEAKTDLALKHIKEGLQIDEYNAQLLEIAASTHLRSNNNIEAITYAQKLITHHPRNPHGYSRHAQALLQQKQPFDANQMALSGLQEAPHNQQLLALASESYQTLERWDQ